MPNPLHRHLYSPRPKDCRRTLTQIESSAKLMTMTVAVHAWPLSGLSAATSSSPLQDTNSSIRTPACSNAIMHHSTFQTCTLHCAAHIRAQKYLLQLLQLLPHGFLLLRHLLPASIHVIVQSLCNRHTKPMEHPAGTLVEVETSCGMLRIITARRLVLTGNETTKQPRVEHD